MIISDTIDILKKEVAFDRTPTGRGISEYGISNINATLEDVKNHGIEVFVCSNCGIILSSLLVPEGCVNCGLKQPIKEKE